jgi:hypothetical protein
MEAQDAADNIREAAEKRELASDERKIKQEEAAERFRRRAAVIIGILAALLAITALGADQARETVTNANIRADDTYNFYQAKNIRQTSYQLAAGDLQALVQTNPTLPAAARASIQARIAGYKKTAARYEDDPSAGGQGKKQLLEQAHRYEEERDRAEHQVPSFNYAQALFQIAIVLGSVSIVSMSRPVQIASIALGVIALLLMLNGYFFHVALPIG